MKNYSLILLIFIFLIPFSKAQQIVYVDPMATGDGSGTSWGNAYTNLIDALNAAPNDVEIWVSNKATLYVSKTADQSDKIIINKNLSIYGGFDGTETAIDQRDVVTPVPTLISGDIGSASVTSDNSHNAFVIQGNVVVDGFNFMFFNSNFSGLPYYGVIAVDTNANCTIRNSAFSQNLGTYSSGVCLSAYKNSVATAENIAVVDNATDGSMFTRNDNAVINISTSAIYNNGISSGLAYLFYSSKNGSPGQALNEETLLNVQGTIFSGNNLSMVYSYFGSNTFIDCEFDLIAAPQYTFNFFGDSSSCFIDNCSFTGTYQTTLIYASGLKNFSFHNSTFDNPAVSSQYFIDVSAANISFINSDFNNLKGSIPFDAYSPTGKVTLKDCNFTNGEASSYYLYIVSKLFISESNRFENISIPLGNYFSCDSAFFRKCVFQTLSGTYSFVPLSMIDYAEVDSCEFSGMSHSYGLFLTGNTLLFKNSKITSSSIVGTNSGTPYLFGNWGGKVTLINNQIEQISALGSVIMNRGTMTVFGNTFKLINLAKPLFQNTKELAIYNSNFEDITMPLVHNDTLSSNNTTPINFELINSIVYSSNDTVIFNQVNAGTFTQTVSNCFTNNSDLAGTNVTTDASTPYADLYAGSSHPDLTDKGLLVSNSSVLPSSDINGDPRIIDGVIDIGAIEFSGQITFVSNAFTPSPIKCYPNPGRDFTNVEVKSVSTLEVFKTDGTKVMSSELREGTNKVQVTNLEEGVYVFYLKSDQDNYQFLFLKQ